MSSCGLIDDLIGDDEEDEESSMEEPGGVEEAPLPEPGMNNTYRWLVERIEGEWVAETDNGEKREGKVTYDFEYDDYNRVIVMDVQRTESGEEGEVWDDMVVSFGYGEGGMATAEEYWHNGELEFAIETDYRTNEVLMLAYMNEEAYETTLAIGKMTYYSRSRKELWIKGMTSGHFQYVKSLTVDCDNDTILAKVSQVGAACHTGNTDKNLLEVLEQQYRVIRERKDHPKKGSYTNYLFEKGLDKILKKIGEESTEIVIASKNSDKENVKYEIADYLYYLMVLMAEKDISFEEVLEELVLR